MRSKIETSAEVLPLSVWFTSGVDVLAIGFRTKASPRNRTIERGRCSLHILAGWVK